MTGLVLLELFVTNLLLFDHQQKHCSLAEHRFPALSPNSARFSYATEGALFISAQLSTDAVSALRKFRVLI